jgi:uncharacterized protein DUF955
VSAAEPSSSRPAASAAGPSSSRPAASAAEPSAHTRARIAAIVERALRESGALGVLPTPLGALREAAGLERVVTAGLSPAILGALWFEERVMFVAEGQSAPRRRFTEAHEIAHALCDWHAAALYEDTEATLFGPARDAIEAEANAAAALLIFQGEAFGARAAALPCGLASVKRLSEEHGASMHATLHHYVQSHHRPLAMLTVGRFPRKDATLPVWRSVTSPAHDGPALRPPALRPGTPLRDLVEEARRSNGASAAIGRGLRAEAHYNRHAFLVLIAPEDLAEPSGAQAQSACRAASSIARTTPRALARDSSYS